MQYKEFLNANDNYNLVMLPEHAGDDERSGLIEVPDGAESFNYLGSVENKFFIKTYADNLLYSREYEKDWRWYSSIYEKDERVCLWKRYTQPESLPFVDDEVQSINDQYAEIEQVRQAVKVKSGSNSDHPVDAMSYGFMGAVATSSGVDATLSERQSTYGNFEDVAFVTENIINVLRKCNYDEMPETHKMAMYMIASKMARLVNGDCNHLDSWHDIQGYAKLVEEIIEP